MKTISEISIKSNCKLALKKHVLFKRKISSAERKAPTLLAF